MTSPEAVNRLSPARTAKAAAHRKKQNDRGGATENQLCKPVRPLSDTHQCGKRVMHNNTQKKHRTLTTGGFESGLLLQLTVNSLPTSQSSFSFDWAWQSALNSLLR